MGRYKITIYYRELNDNEGLGNLEHVMEYGTSAERAELIGDLMTNGFTVEARGFEGDWDHIPPHQILRISGKKL